MLTQLRRYIKKLHKKKFKNQRRYCFIPWKTFPGNYPFWSFKQTNTGTGDKNS